MFGKLKSFSLLAIILLCVVIPTIYCGNGCSVPNPGVPPLPSPLIPSNMSAFIVTQSEQDMELFEAISNSSSNLANMASKSMQAALEVVQGAESIVDALAELTPIISGFAEIFSDVLDVFGFGPDETQKFIQVMSDMCQQVLEDAERYADQEIAQNDIQQLEANFRTASDSFNVVANSTLGSDQEINYVQNAESFLDLNYNLFQVETLLYNYSFFSFNTLYVNAMLHMNAYSALITYYINNSNAQLSLSIAGAAQAHAAEYYTLLNNYANQAQSWRLQQISDAESENEWAPAPEHYAVCRTTFSDNYINTQYLYCSSEECEETELGYICFYVPCGEESSEEEYGHECRNNYYKNVQNALSAYYNQYINSFYPFYQQFQSIQIPQVYLNQTNKSNQTNKTSQLKQFSFA